MSPSPNPWLLLGALLSALAAVLHLAIIVKGGPWYRFFGAGEQMARMAEAGHWYPTVLTASIAIVLGLWSAYALAGAGWLISPTGLPWIRTGLCLITAIYLLRGLAIVPLQWLAPAQVTPFLVWSSVVCAGYGLVHGVGLVQVWERL